jgi:hypothetical protein
VLLVSVVIRFLGFGVLPRRGLIDDPRTALLHVVERCWVRFTATLGVCRCGRSNTRTSRVLAAVVVDVVPPATRRDQ